MSGHTPGPWEADRAKCDEGGHYYQIDSPGLEYGFPRTVADTMNRASGIDPDEDRANALLMAGAPGLAESLEEMIASATAAMEQWAAAEAQLAPQDWSESGPSQNLQDFGRKIFKARAALAKARGGAA